MSAEAGGILGIIVLLGLAGPAIAMALTAVAVGAAVASAVTVATAAARGVNAAARTIHRRSVQASIDRTANRQLIQQRQQMLDLYEQQSRALEQLSLLQDRQRENMVTQAKQVKSIQHREMQELQARSRNLIAEASQQLNQNVVRLNAEAAAQLDILCADVRRQLSQRQSTVDRKLHTLSNQLDRDRAAIADVTPMMNETMALYEQLIGEPDAANLIAPQLEKLRRLQADSRNLIRSGQGQAALATVTAFTQQTMEAFHCLDMARHRRQLLKENLELRAAALKAMVEKGASIQCEGVKGLPTQTDYWVNDALEPLRTHASELLGRIGQGASMKIADYEKLLMEIDRCTQDMDSTMAQARQAYVCAFLRIQMMRKAQRGFAATGWKVQSFGFIDGDFRKPAVMRFLQGSSMADLMLTPVYNGAKREYSVDVRVERHDSGVIDEGLRRAQHRQLSDALKAEGVPVTITCKESTAGRNASLVTKRFSNPGSSTAN